MRRLSCRLAFTFLLSTAATGWCGHEIEAEPPAEREGLFGDWGGLRPKLDERGVYLSADYIAEVIGNPVGGRRRGAAFEGSLDISLELNLQDLIGWRGATIAASATYPHGSAYSERYIGDMGGVTTLDSYDSFRLLELWFEQKFALGAVELSLRVGAQALDAEFWLSQREAILFNNTFSTPAVISGDFPIPSYAFAALGARLAAVFGKPSERAGILQFGAFDGNPASGIFDDPTPGAAPSTDFNKHGTDWALRGSEGAILIGEVGFVFNQPVEKETDPTDEDEDEEGKAVKKNVVAPPRGLGGAYRVGVIHHTDRFHDVADAHLLAHDVEIGRSRARGVQGNTAIYVTAEQELWREPGSDREGLTFFARAAFAPERQNQFDYSWEAGLHYLGLLPGRPNDQLALGFGFNHISPHLASAQHRANRELRRRNAPAARREANEARRDVADFTPEDIHDNPADFADALATLYDALDTQRDEQDEDEFRRSSRAPAQDYEAVLELTYRVQCNRWFSLQPDVQWIMHPGGSSEIDNALVVGLRAAITF